jgi:hypothetical protein
MARSGFEQMAAALLREARGRRAALAGAAASLGAANVLLTSPDGSAKKKKKLKAAFECKGSGNNFLALGEGFRVGQVFTAGRSGTLRQVRFVIDKQPDADPGDFVVQLVKTSGGVPESNAQAVLAASTVPDASVPQGVSTLVANFAGTRIRQGTVYGVVVSRPDSDEIVVKRFSNDVCDGERTDAFEEDPFDNTAGQDIVVSVLVD